MNNMKELLVHFHPVSRNGVVYLQGGCVCVCIFFFFMRDQYLLLGCPCLIQLVLAFSPHLLQYIKKFHKLGQ